MEEYDDLLSGDEELDPLLGAGAARAAQKARQGRPLLAGQYMLRFPYTGVPVGTTVPVNAQADRDCSALDFSAVAQVVATGAAGTGGQITDLRLHGKSLFNNAGIIPVELVPPPTGARINCKFPEVCRAGETYQVQFNTLAGGSATAMAAILLVRAENQ